MTRIRYALLIAAALALYAAVLHAAGTVTVTSANTERGGPAVYTLAWTSSAGGAVSANTFTPRRGKLLSARFVPNTGGTQPTDLYDVTLVDSDSIDLLAGGGANLSNATATIQQWDPPLFLDGTRTLDLVIANAGNAKTGTVVLTVE